MPPATPSVGNSTNQQEPAAPPRADAEQIRNLLAEAMKHPGVADVMRVYSAFTEADKTQTVYRCFQTPFQAEGVSSSAEAIGG